VNIDRDDLLENAPCGLLVTDTDDVVVEVNSTFLQWTGFDRHEVVGREFHLLLEQGSRAFYATRYQAELWARSAVQEIALTTVRADGTEMPVLVNASMMFAEERPSGIRVAVFDSTTRQDYEREMLGAKRQAEASEARVSVLQEASTLFLQARSEAELGAAISVSARKAFAAIDVAVVAYEPDGIGFRIIVGEHLRGLLDALRASRPAGSGALQTDEVFHVATLDDAFRRSALVGDAFRSHRAEAFSAAPIADGENVLGAFICIFGHSRTFEQPAAELQLSLARQAGLALSRVHLQEQLSRMAMHDQLTGLANRALLEERVSHALAGAERSGEPMAIIFVDLDGFKTINDELGHRAGDLVLKEVARRMNAVVRQADIVGRFGGDEFLVVCDAADTNGAGHVAERLRVAISEPIEGLPDGLGVTASVGIAVYAPEVSAEHSADSLVLIADTAMYASKRSGGDRITFATP
jgi:diguanylate cyclase (GGDEF)-like protein/PAS domain S-box-containing protein